MDWTSVLLSVCVMLLGIGQCLLASGGSILRKRLYVLEGEKKSLDNVWVSLKAREAELKEIKGLLGDTGKSMGVIWARVNQQGDKIEALDKEIEELLAE